MARDGSLENALSKEHFKAVTDARREIWTGGFTGMACGTVLGLAIAVIGKKAGFAPKWGPNEMLFGALSGTAAGGLVGAQVRGRPAIDSLGRSGAMQTNARPLRSEYEERVFAAKQAERLALEANASSGPRLTGSSPDEKGDTWAGSARQSSHQQVKQTLSDERLLSENMAGDMESSDVHFAVSRQTSPRERRAAYRRHLEEKQRNKMQ